MPEAAQRQTRDALRGGTYITDCREHRRKITLTVLCSYQSPWYWYSSTKHVQWDLYTGIYEA